MERGWVSVNAFDGEMEHGWVNVNGFDGEMERGWVNVNGFVNCGRTNLKSMVIFFFKMFCDTVALSVVLELSLLIVCTLLS